jgi:hypothetical protein
MARRSKLWLAVAVLFTVLNFAGGVFAAVQGELLHSGVHAGLLLLGAFAVWQLAPRSYARRFWGERDAVIPPAPRELTDRLTHLEQAIDAVAIEVERVGEGQRFITRSFVENGTLRVPGEGAAEPVEINAREPAPHDHS